METQAKRARDGSLNELEVPWRWLILLIFVPIPFGPWRFTVICLAACFVVALAVYKIGLRKA